MTRKERLHAALEGRETDRPPVCFYELDGYRQKPDDPDEYNIYSDPSWKPVLDLARNHSDRVVLSNMRFKDPSPGASPPSEKKEEKWRNEVDAAGNRHTYGSYILHGRTYTSHSMRERDVDTSWTIEYPYKDAEDLAHWLKYSEEDDTEPLPDISVIEETEAALGDTGIVCIDLGDPVMDIAGSFSMEDFLVVALQERDLMHKALERITRRKLKVVEAFAQAAPGRLWRVYGQEYICAPFLPPAAFDDYCTKYDVPIVDAIKQSGGFPRLHCHGNLKAAINSIRRAGWTATDPVEPPPQGDVSLSEARELLGEDITIFGNIEVNAIELDDEKNFTTLVRTALKEGPNKQGRRFVLMPSSSPFGRHVSKRVVKNYSIMVEECFNAEQGRQI
jgi:hypothetical protein